MSSLMYVPRKYRRSQQYVIRLRFTSPEVKAMAPRIAREVKACFNKCLPGILKAKAKAKARAKRKRR